MGNRVDLKKKREEEDVLVLTKVEAGELEMRKAFEETATKNINAILDYSKTTREIARSAETRADDLEKKLRQREKELAELKQMISGNHAQAFTNEVLKPGEVPTVIGPTG